MHQNRNLSQFGSRRRHLSSERQTRLILWSYVELLKGPGMAGPFTVATCSLFVLAPVESVDVAVDLCHGEGKRIVNVKVHTLKDELCSVVYAGCTGQFEASEGAGLPCSALGVRAIREDEADFN